MGAAAARGGREAVRGAGRVAAEGDLRRDGARGGGGDLRGAAGSLGGE